MSAIAASLLAVAAAVFATLSLVRGVRSALARGGDAHAAAAGAGAAAVLVLLLANGGGLLRWRYALAGEEMRDAGLVLGTALLAALAGTLLLAAAFASGGSAEGRPPLARLLGRRALLLAWALLACGTGLVLVRSAGAGLTAAPREPVALSAVLAALGLALLACLADAGATDAGRAEGAARRDARVAAVLAVTATLAAGITGWMAAGTSLTGASRALAAAALFSLAAVPPARLTLTRRALVLAALVAALPA